MSKTDRHRPYRVRIADPTERHNVIWYDGCGTHPMLINAGCLNVKCACRASGYPDEKRATTRRDRYAAVRDITERMADQ